MMEYNPAVYTHNTSSSETSTNSNSTWEPNHHPLPYFNSIESGHFINQNDDSMPVRLSLPDVSCRIEYHANSEHEQEPKNDQLDTMTHGPIYLQHGNPIAVSFTKKYPMMKSIQFYSKPPPPTIHQIRLLHELETRPSSTAKKQKSNGRDNAERANHAATEQKRRNTISLGFKDLADTVPTLKNISNSKSTILFKAVEYIKHLDKRNLGLREKVSLLQVRMIQQQHRQNSTAVDVHRFSHLPVNVISTLIAHQKSQQNRLEALQEQVRLEQQHLLFKPEHFTCPPFPLFPSNSHN